MCQCLPYIFGQCCDRVPAAGVKRSPGSSKGKPALARKKRRKGVIVEKIADSLGRSHTRCSRCCCCCQSASQPLPASGSRIALSRSASSRLHPLDSVCRLYSDPATTVRRSVISVRSVIPGMRYACPTASSQQRNAGARATRSRPQPSHAHV